MRVRGERRLQRERGRQQGRYLGGCVGIVVLYDAQHHAPANSHASTPPNSTATGSNQTRQPASAT
jgi:chemotaxis receptor (MCP) glutamine deamidase CheD